MQCTQTRFPKKPSWYNVVLNWQGRMRGFPFQHRPAECEVCTATWYILFIWPQRVGSTVIAVHRGRQDFACDKRLIEKHALWINVIKLSCGTPQAEVDNAFRRYMFIKVQCNIMSLVTLLAHPVYTFFCNL